jgi:hypothetical protein
MDLFFSGQSMLVLLLVAAGCLVLARAFELARLRWHARSKGAVRAVAHVAELPEGEEVTIVGVLGVQGAMCSRFEDAHPVAATSYCQPPGRGPDRAVRTWHARAERLYLEIEGVRVELDGPLVVLRGSCEWTVEGGLDRLRERVRDRVYAADVKMHARMRGESQHHVFRSLEPGDRVAVTGVVERNVDADGPASYRRHGGGWRLKGGDDGVLSAQFRGRPATVRRFGRLPVYAAAAGVAAASIVASFAAGTQPACSDHRELCALYGLCGTRLLSEGNELTVTCVAPSTQDCQQSLRCRKLGACSASDWGECIATSDSECRHSLSCELYGRCSVSPEGECVALSQDDCQRAGRCMHARFGCAIEAGTCTPKQR